MKFMSILPLSFSIPYSKLLTCIDLNDVPSVSPHALGNNPQICPG